MIRDGFPLSTAPMRISSLRSSRAFLGIVIAATVLSPSGIVRAEDPVVTRAEAVMYLLWNASYPVGTVTPTGKNIAPDVRASSWYAAAMAAGIRAGIVVPDSQTGFLYPDAAVTRGEFLWMLGRLFKMEKNLPSSFADVPNNAPYAPYAGAAERYHLFLLSHPSYLSPLQPITPLDAASTMHALFARFPALRSSYRGAPSSAASANTSARNTLGTSSTSSSVSTVHQTSSKATALVQITPSVSPQEKAKLQLIALTNHERSIAGLPPLKRNPLLERAAQKHADDMRSRGYFSHLNPEGQSYVDRIRATEYFTITDPICTCQPYYDIGKTLEQRAETTPNYIVTKAQQICSCKPTFSVGENLARGQANAETVIQEWMASPPHRRTIVQPLFQEIGVGISGDIWVENFGSVRTK